MKRPTKQEIRKQLDRETEAYLRHGGAVRQVERGATGLVDGRYDERSLAFEKPREERTPVSDVLQVIDQRREAQRKPHKTVTAPASRPRRPKKKVIYDDFGEPLRVVWED
jgi:hypothetical protein